MFFLFGLRSFAQTSCSNAINLTPTTPATCISQTTASSTGSAACAGAGYGGGGQLTWYKFTTDASNSCVNLNFSSAGGTPLSGTMTFSLYTTCSGSTASGAVTLTSAQVCQDISGGSATFTTSDGSGGISTAANTTYYVKVWSKNAGSFDLCTEKAAPAANDECAGAIPLDANFKSTNNNPNCYYSQGATDPIPSQFCAGSLENTSWFTFTAQNSGSDIVITIKNIVCTGGGSGFQIGVWKGTCSTMTYVNCASGSGGTVTFTIPGSSVVAGQKYIVGLDGNAGAHCKFDINATNTMPLGPVAIELVSFSAVLVNGKVICRWITASELNSDYFELESASSSQAFQKAGTVKASGNSSSLKRYEFTDPEKKPNGIYYYHLRSIDKDGESKTYPPVMVNIGGNSKTEIQSISAKPEEIRFDINCGQANIVTLTIYNILGNKILEKSIQLESGQNLISVPVSLPKGLYLSNLSSSENYSSQNKFTIY